MWTAGVSALADPVGPTIATHSPFAFRSGQTYVLLSGLTAGTSYEVTSSGGVFEDSGTSSLAVIGTGGAEPLIVLTDLESVPATTTTLNLTLTQGGAVVATDSVPFRPPNLTVSSLCALGSRTAYGYGYAVGDYTLSAPHVTFSPSTVHVVDGTLPPVQVTGDAGLPATYPVTVTLAGTTTTVLTAAQTRSPGFLTENDNGYTPWQIKYDGVCFAPGEWVRFTPRDASATGTTVKTDSQGHLQATIALHPSTAAHRFVGIDALGLTSGQTAVGDLLGPVFGTTLLSGQTLHGELISPHRGYGLTTNCNPAIVYWYANGGSADQWHALAGGPRRGTCTLTLRTNGDLVDLSSTGTVLWHTGTTGTGNKLTMRDDGNLVLTTARGTTLWSSKGGRVPRP